MTDYSELVKALRICHVVDCDDCVLKKECVESIIKGERPYVLLHNAAADAIEELQQIADHHEQTAKEYWKEACEYKAQLPKRGEWVRVEDGESYHYECSECGERPLYSRYGDVVLSGVCPLCGAKMEAQDGRCT